MIATVEHMEKAKEQLAKTVEDMNAFARDSWNVALKSSSALTKGWDETTRSATSLSQEGFNRAVNASKTILSAKSLSEMVELQNEHVKETLDHILASTNKLSEISARVFKDVFEPVSQHANSTVSKIMEKVRTA